MTENFTMPEHVSRSFGPEELLDAQTSEREERSEEVDAVIHRMADITLRQALPDLQRRKYDSPAVHKALTILMTAPALGRIHPFIPYKGLEFKHLLLKLFPDYRERSFERGVRCIGSELLSESWAFTSPVLGDRFHQAGRQKIIRAIGQGYGRFSENLPTASSHMDWMADTGLSRESWPFERVHFSDPLYAQQRLPYVWTIYGFIHPQEIFGPFPASSFFHDQTLADLDPGIANTGSLFTRDTVLSLYETGEQCDMLAAWRFDPAILHSGGRPSSPETYRAIMENFKTFILGQVAEGGIVFFTLGSGPTKDDLFIRRVFAQCLARVLQTSDTPFLAYPHVNPLRNILWARQPLFKYRSIPPELISALPDIVTMLSLSAFMFEVTGSVHEALEEFVRNDTELQQAIDRGRQASYEIRDDHTRLETLQNAHESSVLSRKLRKQAISKIAEQFGQGSAGAQGRQSGRRRRR